MPASTVVLCSTLFPHHQSGPKCVLREFDQTAQADSCISGTTASGAALAACTTAHPNHTMLKLLCSLQDAANTAAAAAAAADTNSTAAGNVTRAPMGAEESPRISCRVHIANNTASATTFGHVRSSLKVAAAADVTDVSLILQVQHPDVAALEVRLVFLWYCVSWCAALI